MNAIMNAIRVKMRIRFLFLFILLGVSVGCVERVTLGARDNLLQEQDGEILTRDASALLKKDGSEKCSPPLPCNWCNGTTIKDSKGCIVGYRCANGVNPCTTQPCSQTAPTDCKADEYCGADMLCWPLKTKDAGTAKDVKSFDAGTAKDVKSFDAGTAKDVKSFDAGTAKDVKSFDAGTAKDVKSLFACGGRAVCGYDEYCMVTHPGACGGNPVPDSGMCPPGCTPTTCHPSMPDVCLCKGYGCDPLPPGCHDCSCVTIGSSCQCAKDSQGQIVVECFMP